MASAPARSPTTRRILRRTDLYLLPFLSLLFLLNSLDRSNVGNAETAGFTRHAGLQERDLNDAVAAFFVVFVALQPVGAALGKRVGVGRWVGGVMCGWGILTAANAIVRTRGQLIFLRICIGALEAGFYPTTVFYLSLFYTRYEFAQRLGMFFGQYAVAGAFGGLVSYFVFRAFPGDPETSSDSPEKRGWHSYQLLFVVEGLATFIVAIITFLWLPTGPGTAWWLTPRERAIAQRRVLRDRRGDLPSGPTADVEQPDGFDSESNDVDLPAVESHARKTYPGRDSGEIEQLSSSPLLPPSSSHHLLHSPSAPTSTSQIGGEAALTRRDVYEALTDSKVWHLLIVNICSSVPGMSFSVFLPLVIKGMGYSALSSNLLTVPPFCFGALTLWAITYFSDRSRQRLRYILLGLGINLVGLVGAVCLPTTAYAWRYVSLCVLLAGSYVASPLTVAWLSGNIDAPGKRAVVLGINGWGNLAGVLASLLYAPRYAPNYTLPLQVTLALVFVAAAGYAAFALRITHLNRQRKRILAAWAPEDVERERRYGMGPAAPEEAAWGLGAWEMDFDGGRWMKGRVLGLSQRTKTLVAWAVGYDSTAEEALREGRRRGDERITFVYGL